MSKHSEYPRNRYEDSQNKLHKKRRKRTHCRRQEVWRHDFGEKQIMSAVKKSTGHGEREGKEERGEREMHMRKALPQSHWLESEKGWFLWDFYNQWDSKTGVLEACVCVADVEPWGHCSAPVEKERRSPVADIVIWGSHGTHWERHLPLLEANLGEVAFVSLETKEPAGTIAHPTTWHRHRDTCWGQLTWTLVFC